MPAPVIATKLFIPPPRPNGVARPRLIARLNEGLSRKLTLISAPAGFGKTSLAASWLASLAGIANGEVSIEKAEQSTAHASLSILNSPPKAAWLSLDEGDNDPVRFLLYLVAALQTVVPTVGAGVAASLQAPQPPPIEALLPLLLNELATLPQPVVLVLDDYHLLDARPIDQALALLVEQGPPQLHLVITTREDPPLPLARLRARGQLTELRVSDLRFTASEAAEFLKEAMGLPLAAEHIAELEERTEGWVAGLQLAALSLQGHEDVRGFISAFAGDNRYIGDYLVDEVLQRQPEPVRHFLLQTSILDRLSGSLCDAVTHQEGGSTRLEALHRGNFFLVPLDEQRRWYRYHHLFADVLQAHLRAEQPDLVPTLHQRASAWHAQHGSQTDAIRHALAGEDFTRAADLIERAVPTVRRNREEAALLGWLKALPDEVLHRRPVLSAMFAQVLLAIGTLEGVEERLRAAEYWLEAPSATSSPAGEPVVADKVAFRDLPGAVAVARAGLTLARGDIAATMTYARRVLDLVPQDDHVSRGGAACFLGLACWAAGDLEAAHQWYAQGMAHLQQAGSIADAINGAVTLAGIRIAQGRLREAMRAYQRGLQLGTEQGEPVVRGTADMHVGMSELERERDDLDAATQHLLRSKELGEHAGFAQNRYRWYVAMARIKEAEGDLSGAANLLDEAQRLSIRDFSPNVRPIGALKARVWLAQGRLAEARDWAREQGLSAQDELSYGREFEHITLARILLARGQRDPAGPSAGEALGLLQRLLEAAEAGERTGSVIEILILLSLAHQAYGDIPAALAALTRALGLAEPEGYVRLFADEGPPMLHLLRAVAARGLLPDYTGTLLAACGAEQQPSAGEAPLPHPLAAQPLVEPLSQRELAVLRLLRTELSGPEIARELVIGLSTVRTYTKSIYSKLDVTSRRAAVKRATELGLI
jgi:LuxR family maltose regulon positive regulatory protein